MRLLLFTLSFLILISCNQNSVALEKTNAKGEVPVLGNLSFRFSNALVTDSMLNQWDSTEFISFTPTIPGRFRWEQPDLLIFSPSRPLAPATTYSARLKQALLQNSSFGKIARADDVKFNTPAVQLEDAQIHWTLEEGSGRAIAESILYFNYPVPVNSLREKLILTLDEKQIPYTIQTRSGSNTISLLLQGLNPVDKDLEGKFHIAKGLLPEGGTEGSTEDIEIPARLPSPFNLVISDMTGTHDGINGTVVVRTSQPVDPEGIASLVKITPAVKFSIASNDEGFSVKSTDFNSDKSYLVSLSSGIRGRVGGKLQEQYDNNVSFGELQPQLKFAAAKSVYLSSASNRMIELRIVNVPKIKVIISKVYESNLLASQAYGYYPRDDRSGSDEEYYGENDYASADQSYTVGEVVYEKEIETRTLPQLGKNRLFAFNIEDRLPDLKGIYHIKVRSASEYWTEDSRFISVSDLGLIAREGRDKLYVFVNSVKTAKEISGVNVIAYGANNQVLGMAATNEAGVAEIGYTRKEFAGFRPSMIVAKSESDFNFLPLKTTAVNTSRFEVGGKRINSTGLDAFIYGERDIYRPGEEIHFSAIVRNSQWKSPGQLPVRFRMVYPNGKEMKVFRKTLNDQGSAEGMIDLPASAITGSYNLELYTSTDVLMGSYQFRVEEFVPDRIRVGVTIDNKDLEPGQPVKLSLDAANFFGPPAADRKYESEIQLSPKFFQPKKFPRYNFAIQNQGLSLDKVVKEGRTDGEGKATVNYEVPALFKNTGILRATFYTTVFDETGRPVSKGLSADVYTQPVFYGIGDDGNWYYPLNQPISFPLIALDKKEMPVSGTVAKVKVIRHEYRTVLAKSGSYFRYQSQEEEKIIVEQDLTINNESTKYSFIPRAPGNYEIRVTARGASAYVVRKFYSYGSWGGDNNSFEVDTEGSIDIETDKSVYNAGNTAKILFKCPFNGKMLVTLESDKVLWHQYVNVEKRNASLDIPVNADHLPNVFITATLFKPHGISEIPLTVAHGYQNLKVEDRSRINKVELKAALNSRSLKDQEVAVMASPGSLVTLAAVDNGVLQVSDFKTPDPYHYFYGDRALAVDGYDLYPLLFPELRARLSSSGGDGEREMTKRVNPMPSKRIRLLSYWSGITRTDNEGRAKFSIKIPKFSGQVRLMAIAYRDGVFGSAEAAMTIADPVVTSVAVPRFLSPGDTLTVPVTVTNTTKERMDAASVITTSGPLKVAGTNSRKISVAPGSEERVEYIVVAGNSIDTGRIVVETRTAAETFRDETAIGVRPPASLQKISDDGLVKAGSTQKIIFPNKDFMPGTERYSLVVSRSPLLAAGSQLRYLLSYPYGCTEQVISAAFPMLYFGELVDQMNPEENRQSEYGLNVMEAIRKIKLAQLFNGAVTLWEGEGTENWWASAYAAHFLLEAGKAGFDPDQQLLNGLLGYISSRLSKKEVINYYYNRDQKKKIAPKELAYSLYILALAGTPNLPVMNYYKANPELLSLDSKYLLSIAYGLSGDRKKFVEVLPTSFSGEESVKQTGGSFYSPTRDEAIALNALLDLDPSNQQVNQMAAHVAQRLRNAGSLNTQECAFGVLALGKIAARSGPSNATADLKVKGRLIAKFTGKDLRLGTEQLRGGSVDVETGGKGNLYYFWEMEGTSMSGAYHEEDNYLRIRRTFFDRYGQKKAGTTFRQNELVIVQLSLDKKYGGEVNNIVVTDLLPAGFEIENPRTKEIPGMDWIKDAASPEAMDIRDDRINLFTSLGSKGKVFYYAVRAVSPGIFRQGPVAADAMYNGEYHSFHGAQTIRIYK